MTAEPETPPTNPFAAAASAPVDTAVPGVAREAPAPTPTPVSPPAPEPVQKSEPQKISPDDPLADNDEALDLEEDGDTFWLMQRILWGLLKTLFVIAVIGGLAWVIWGKNIPKKTTSHEPPIPTAEAPTPPAKTFVQKEIATAKNFLPATFSKKSPPESTVVISPPSPDDGAVIAASWNVWLESERLRGQHDSPGKALLWAKKVEALFETPFERAVASTNPVVRAQKLDRLRRTINTLYAQGMEHADTLQIEYSDFTRRAAYEKQISQTNEAAFLTALNRRDPTGLDQFLEAKIQAEKKYTELAMQAEARAILIEKLAGYLPVLTNVDTVLHVNRDAIVHDIRVVGFPDDPFYRVIDLRTWEQLNP